jgi:hypothetical protein
MKNSFRALYRLVLSPRRYGGALKLFHESQAVFGYLSVHPDDVMGHLPDDVDFKAVHPGSGLYRRVV